MEGFPTSYHHRKLYIAKLETLGYIPVVESLGTFMLCARKPSNSLK